MLEHFKVGARVYEPYRIQQPGLVIGTVDKMRNGQPERHCTVKWMNGTASVVPEYYLRDFTVAMEEHKRKYEKFLKLIERIDKLND